MYKKKLSKLITSSALLIIILASPLYTYSAELDSTNFKIVGATTNGGGTLQTTDGDYSALLTVGSISNDPRNYSTSYRMDNSPEHAFIANVPSISCFETTTDGYSNCTTGPTELTTGGMVALCGVGGCYNKGRFEISTNENPSDTLYSIEISTDGFSADTQYLDGTTFKPENSDTHNIDDFKTKTEWETEAFNIQGLASSTLYSIRIVALHGAFTLSDPSPLGTATTAAGSIFFDIDIANSSGTTSESSGPYSIAFTNESELIGGSAAVTATQRIWLDASSNSEGGFAIVVKGKNGGLFSSTTSQTITSATANLDLTTSGFGIQSEYINFSNDPSIGDITAMTDYAGNLNSVGQISTDPLKIYDANGPIDSGRMALKVIAKPGTDKDPATDYQEEITILFVPRY